MALSSLAKTEVHDSEAQADPRASGSGDILTQHRSSRATMLCARTAHVSSAGIHVVIAIAKRQAGQLGLRAYGQ